MSSITGTLPIAAMIGIVVMYLEGISLEGIAFIGSIIAFFFLKAQWFRSDNRTQRRR